MIMMTIYDDYDDDGDDDDDSLVNWAKEGFPLCSHVPVHLMHKEVNYVSNSLRICEHLL